VWLRANLKQRVAPGTNPVRRWVLVDDCADSSEQSLSRVQAELDTINSRYRGQFGSYVDATKYDLAATSLEESLVSGLRPSLLVLLAAVGFVLADRVR